MRTLFLLLLLTLGLRWAWGAIDARKAAVIRGKMHWAQLTVHNGETPQQLAVKVADSQRERYTGYQHLARDQAVPIWFQFDAPDHNTWHMENVAYPLDIAFVDGEGEVIDVQRMQPGQDGYLPPSPIRGALELPAGRLAALGIEPGTRLALEP